MLTQTVEDRIKGPQTLHDAWVNGNLADGDLRHLIPDTWLYTDWPERVIGAEKWVLMFRATGFIAIPYWLPRPDAPLTLFRGATPERREGMSWTQDVNRADQFRQRHSWHGPTAIYQAVVPPAAVLALLERRGEGPPEVVVDPQSLTAIDQLGDLTPQRQRERG